MTGDGSERVRIWDRFPNARKLESGLLDNGFGGVIPVVDAYVGIDTQALRWAAFNIYGHTDTWGADFDINLGALLNPAEEADDAFFSHAPTPKILQAISKAVDNKLLKYVQDEWAGAAYRSFENYILKLQKFTLDEAYRMNRLGKALEEVAAALDEAKPKMENQIAGAAGMLTTGVTFLKGADPMDIFLTLSNEVIKIHGDVEQRSKLAAKLVSESADGEGDLRAMVIAAPMPSDTLPDYNKDPDDWEPRNG